MTGPLVSVITPAYQAAEFIETAIRSVHAQEYRPIEHVVIDDGSLDATAAIARELSSELRSRDYEVRLVEPGHNQGAARALDLGLEESRGELVCWLSADDAFYAPEKTAEQVRILKTIPDAAGTFDWITATGPSPEKAKRVTARWPWFMEALPSLRRMEPAHGLIGLMFANPINGTSVMLRREWLERCGRFDAELGNYDADADLWMRIQALGGRLVGRRGCGTFYRVHAGQTSKDLVGMGRGTAITRLRMIQALHDQGALLPILSGVTDLLILARASRAHRLRPPVAASLARCGLEGATGSLARTLRGMLEDLDAHGLVDETHLAEWSVSASNLLETPTFLTFRQGFAGPDQVLTR